MDCIFCKIANNEFNSYKIYEDDIVLVFLDIAPDANGHSLIVPKKHYTDILDIDEVTLSHISKVSSKIAKELSEKLNPTSIKIVQNNGEIQEVKHFHTHVIPYSNSPLLSVEEVYNILKKILVI